MEDPEFKEVWPLDETDADGYGQIESEPAAVLERRMKTMDQPKIDWALKEAQQMEVFYQAVKEVQFLEGSIESVNDLRNNIRRIVANFRTHSAKIPRTGSRLYKEVKDIQDSFSECYDRLVELLNTNLLAQRHAVASCTIIVSDFKTRAEKLQSLVHQLYADVKDIQIALVNCENRLLLGKKLLEERRKIADNQNHRTRASCKPDSIGYHQMSSNPSSEGEALTQVTTPDEKEEKKMSLEACDEMIAEDRTELETHSTLCDEAVTVEETEVKSAGHDHTKQSPSASHLEAATSLCDLRKSAKVQKGNKYEKKRKRKAKGASLLELALRVEKGKEKHEPTSSSPESPHAANDWDTWDGSTPLCNKFVYGGYSFWVPDHSNNVPPLDVRPYAIKAIPGKGEGVVATQNIEPCIRIMQEKFIFLVERRMYSDPDEMPTNDSIEAFVQECLTREEAEPFMNLGNSFSKKQHYLGRLRTNMDLVRMEQTGGVEASEGIPLFPTICKINHSCCPNAFFSWNRSLGCGIIQTLRAIQEGDEITIAYKDMAIKDSRTRTYQLDWRWGFKCRCSRCSMPYDRRKVDDDHVRELQKKLNFFEYKLHEAENEGTLAHSAQILSKGMELLDSLKFLSPNVACLAAEWMPRVYYYLACAAMSHGEVLRSSLFAESAATLYGMFRGTCFAMDTMRRLQENPRAHHRWQMYSSNWYQVPWTDGERVALTKRADGEELYVDFVELKKDEQQFRDWLYRLKHLAQNKML